MIYAIKNKKNEVRGMRKQTLLKLNKIFKAGYIPSRNKKEDYASKDNMFKKITNCFEHACFNLTNEQLKHFDKKDFENFFCLPNLKNTELSREEIYNIVKHSITSTGLKVKSAEEELKPNEWKVAMYFSEHEIDLHFLLQEKDGSWSGKFGELEKVDRFQILPLKIYRTHTEYTLYKVFAIVNPYIFKDSKNGIKKEK